MNFKDIIKQAEEDCKIDRTNLATESLNIPQLHCKWLTYLATEQQTLSKLRIEKDKLHKSKSDFYGGKSSSEEYKAKNYQGGSILKKDIEYYITVDEDTLKLREKLELQEYKVDFVKEFIKQLNSRGYVIKNAIDMIKFENGLN